MRQRTRRSWFWLQGAAAGAVAVAIPGVALVVATLLFPAIALLMTETAKGKPVARTMLLAGSGAVALPLRTLWVGGCSLPAALDLLADPACPLVAWIACGVGWLLCEALQLAVGLAIAAKTRRAIGLLRREEAELREEWSLDGGAANQV